MKWIKKKQCIYISISMLIWYDDNGPFKVIFSWSFLDFLLTWVMLFMIYMFMYMEMCIYIYIYIYKLDDKDIESAFLGDCQFLTYAIIRPTWFDEKLARNIQSTRTVVCDYAFLTEIYMLYHW